MSLLPCPFCAGVGVPKFAVGEHWVICIECKASVALSATYEIARERWNTRAGKKMELAK